MPGIEPGTSHMRSARSTTELHPPAASPSPGIDLHSFRLALGKFVQQPFWSIPVSASVQHVCPLPEPASSCFPRCVDPAQPAAGAQEDQPASEHCSREPGAWEGDSAPIPATRPDVQTTRAGLLRAGAGEAEVGVAPLRGPRLRLQPGTQPRGRPASVAPGPGDAYLKQSGGDPLRAPYEFICTTSTPEINPAPWEKTCSRQIPAHLEYHRGHSELPGRRMTPPHAPLSHRAYAEGGQMTPLLFAV